MSALSRIEQKTGPLPKLERDVVRFGSIEAARRATVRGAIVFLKDKIERQPDSILRGTWEKQLREFEDELAQLQPMQRAAE